MGTPLNLLVVEPANGEESDILAVTTPAFVVRTPDVFLELMRLRRPNPETGQPDMEKLGAFLAEHPESQTAVQATLSMEPPASYATLTYYSPHAFKLANAEGQGTWVRYHWRPEAGEAGLEIGRRLVRSDGRGPLQEHRSGVEALVDQHGADPGLPVPVGDGPLDGSLLCGAWMVFLC